MLKDTFELSRDILNQYPTFFMASFDVDSLFSNIPLDEIINIIEKFCSEIDLLKWNLHSKKKITSVSIF